MLVVFPLPSCNRKTIKMKQKINLQEEENLSIRDKWPIPNVSFVLRFYCIII